MTRRRMRRPVTAYCPTCHVQNPDRDLAVVRRLDGALVDDHHVWLVRTCPDHGEVETLYEEVPEIVDYLERWTAPLRGPTPDVSDNRQPIPQAYRCGLGPQQRQHTCVLLEDVTDDCNLRCPTCYAGSGPGAGGTAAISDVIASVDRRLDREGGSLDVVMISGGEPTLYPDLPALLDLLIERDIVRIVVNTNGIRLASDDRLLGHFAGHRDRIEVYFQFDGVEGATSQHHRGADLRAVKAQSLQRLSAAGVFSTLVMTAALGVNDHEIGAVVRHALDTPFIGGVVIQPVFGSGRSMPIDSRRRLTHTGVLKRLGPQTDGTVTWRDLIALPCSHPHCASVGYMLRTDDGRWRSLVSLIGHERLRAHLDLVSNRLLDSSIVGDLKTLVRESLTGLLSSRVSPVSPRFRELFRNVNDVCDLGIGTWFRRSKGRADTALRRLAATRVKRLQVKPFMDMSTMIEERLLQCCVHVGTFRKTGHQAVPFCALQAWPELASARIGRAE